MTPSPAKQKTTIRHRQIGRKVLQADRLSAALSNTKNTKTERKKFVKWLPVIKPKHVIAACVAVITVSVLALGCTQFFMAQAAASQKAAVAKQQTKLKKKSIEADACRRAKAAQKADLIGKVTYDELYDGDECDK